MTEKPAPESILELIVCSCKRKCGSGCQCLQHGLNCTDVCPCSYTCNNSLAMVGMMMMIMIVAMRVIANMKRIMKAILKTTWKMR